MAEQENNQSDHSDRQPRQPQPQETTVIHTASPASPQSNANLLMILVLFVILLIGVALAFTLKSQKDEDATKRKDLTDKIALLDSNEGDSANRVQLESRVNSIVGHANQIRIDFNEMRTRYAGNLNELKALKASTRANLDTITSLSTANSKLQQELDALKGQAASAVSYQQQLELLRKDNVELQRRIAELSGGPTKESMNALRSNLDNERLSANELRNELNDLKRRMTGMVDSSKVTELEAMKIRNRELEQQLAALRAKLDFSKLFVKSYDQLPLDAQSVFNELRTLENNSPTELAQAYGRIRDRHNAENIQQVKFGTGSSQMDFTQQSSLKNKMLSTSETDYFLVVGYASTSGDAQSNETLSANRATGVASLVNQIKKAGQDVRAVYLGQTSRFSKTSKSENQLCEIWRISK